MLGSWITGLLDWRARRSALGEFQQLRRQEVKDLLWEYTERLDTARAACDNGAHDKALAIWADMRTRYWDLAVKSPKAIRLLMDLHRFDDAEALATEGQRRFPNQAFYLERLADIARHRGDLAEAIRRWAMVRKKYPGQPSGYVEGAACLREGGQMDQAAALLREGMARFPDSLECRMEDAHLAEHRQDWEGARERWVALNAAHPGNLMFVKGLANSLDKLGRIEESEALLEEAKIRFPVDLGIWANLAWAAHNRGDWPTAAARWQKVREHFPLEPLGYQAGAAALREMGQDAAMEAVLRDTVDRFPHDIGAAYEYAMAAHTRGDWPAAIERWAAFRVSFPERHEGYLWAADALAKVGRSEEAEQLRQQHAANAT
jgi:predicted Zn-dependent protease